MRARVRPSKSNSMMGMIVGIGVFVIIPQFGEFGVLWTLIAIAGTGYHAINVFSERGIAREVVDFDADSTTSSKPSLSVEERLRKLESLRQQALVTETEYEDQKQRILDDL